MSEALRIEHLTVSVHDSHAWRVVLDDISLTLGPSRATALVGESGSGKSLLAALCLGLIPRGVRVDGGSVRLGDTNVLDCSASQLSRIRGAHIALVPEDPRASLDPNCTVGALMLRVAKMHGFGRSDAKRRGLALLTRFGLANPEEQWTAHPAALSDGDCQRMSLVLALLNRPRVLLLDEPMAALDTTSQSLVTEALSKLQVEEKLSLLLISHDLGLVAETAEDLAVMYAGKLVETGPLEFLFERPGHPYTRGLLQSIPPMDVTGPPEARRLPTIPGTLDHHTAKAGCAFRLRCAYRETKPPGHERCDAQAPELRQVRPAHSIRCHYAEELA